MTLDQKLHTQREDLLGLLALQEMLLVVFMGFCGILEEMLAVGFVTFILAMVAGTRSILTGMHKGWRLLTKIHLGASVFGLLISGWYVLTFSHAGG